MKLFLTTISIALASSTLAAATPVQPAPAIAHTAPEVSSDRLQLARRFVALVNPAETMMRDMREATVQMAMASAGNEADEAARAIADQYASRLLARGEPVIRKGMPAVLEAYAGAYAREFSSDELVQITAFAQTAAGRRYFAREGFLDLDSEVVAAHRAMGEEFEAITYDLNREMCAEKAVQRIAAGDVKAKCPLSEPDIASG